MENLIIFILIFIGGIIFGHVIHGVRSAIKKAEEAERRAAELETIRQKMERSIRNQSDYTIQAAKSFMSGDIAAAITASELAEEESIKFQNLAEEFNKIYHSQQ